MLGSSVSVTSIRTNTRGSTSYVAYVSEHDTRPTPTATQRSNMSVPFCARLQSHIKSYTNSLIYATWPDEYATVVPLYYRGKVVPNLYSSNDPRTPVPAHATALGLAQHEPTKVGGTNVHKIVYTAHGHAALRKEPNHAQIELGERIILAPTLTAIVTLHDHTTTRVWLEPTHAGHH